MLAIQLIVGLCNPGKTYEGTRHNAGAFFVEELARRCGAALTPESVLVGRPASGADEQVVVFGPVENARALLARLFGWAWQASNAPLPFFPRTSRKFAELAIADKLDRAWRDARFQFEGSDSAFGPPPEGAALEIQRVWEGVSPLEAEDATTEPTAFDVLAEGFFGPLLEARRVLRA